MTTDDMALDAYLDEELSTHLATYATALDPSPEALGRMRGAILRSTVPAPVSAPRPAPWSLRLRASLRRPVLAFAAAALLVVLAVGSAFAAAPGGPLYGARLWLETATLPTDPGARTDAEIARLDDRLAEADQAAAAGNGGAVTAALDAYAGIVDAAFAAAGGDLSREQHLQLVLERHRAVLEALIAAHADRGSSAAAIQGALDRGEQTIERILSETPATPGGSGGGGQPGTPSSGGPDRTPGGGNGQGQGGGNGQGQGGGNGQGQGGGNGPGAKQTPPAGPGGAPSRPSNAPTASHRPSAPDPSKSPRP